MYDYYSFPVENEFFSALLRKAEQARKERFTFLLVGRTGVGKSSTVNSLMNQRAARVGNYEATTKEVKAHEYEAFGIRFVVVDTPGLCDDLEEGSNDENYVELIRRDVEKFDCLWFVTRLDETRVSGDEKRAIKVITKAFGPQTWEHAIIVFTFANSLGPDIPYHEACETRAVLIRKEIAKWVKEQDIVDSIPAVPVDNKKRETPDGQPWLGDLYATVIERISNRGFLPFFLATYKRVELHSKTSSDNQGRIVLDSKQAERIGERIMRWIEWGGSATGIGASIGAIFGPPGAVIGGLIGLFLGLSASHVAKDLRRSE